MQPVIALINIQAHHAATIAMILRALLTALHEEEIKRSESEMKDNLNSLAVKVGELQARILRLDAFGERLAKAAGIKPTEFRFDEKPGQGGPQVSGVGREHSVRVASSPIPVARMPKNCSTPKSNAARASGRLRLPSSPNM